MGPGTKVPVVCYVCLGNGGFGDVICIFSGYLLIDTRGGAIIYCKKLSNQNINESRYFLFKNSYISGPFGFDILKAMFKDNKVISDDLICLEGSNNWQTYNEVFILTEQTVDITNETQQTANDQPKINYFLRHWQGDLPLSRTYWVNVFLISFAFKIISESINKPTTSFAFGPVTGSLFCLFWFSFVIVISVWQIVGLWRSSSKHCLRGGAKVWSVLAKIVAFCYAINSFTVVINTIIPASSECISIIGGDHGVPPYKITVLPGGNDIEFRGGIRSGSSKELAKILSSIPLAKVLHIESNGGRVYEAIEIAKLVKNRNMITYTAGSCQSAATLILLAGKERVIAANAKVGFHSASFPGLTADFQRELQQDMRLNMKKAGVSDAFIDRVVNTPSNDMWFPTYREMCDAGVVTSKTYGERFASSQGLITDRDIEKIIQACSKYPYFQVLQHKYPYETNQALHEVLNALRAGKSEGESYFIFSQFCKKVFQECLPSASDESILEVRDALIDFLRNNMHKNSEACIAMLTGAKINYSRAFNNSQMAPLNNAMISVISSGHNKGRIPINTFMAEQDRELIATLLFKEFGDDVLLLGNKNLLERDALKALMIYLSCFEQTKTLPLNHQANFFRFLMIGD